jgi:hypothetical protein
VTTHSSRIVFVSGQLQQIFLPLLPTGLGVGGGAIVVVVVVLVKVVVFCLEGGGEDFVCVLVGPVRSTRSSLFAFRVCAGDNDSTRRRHLPDLPSNYTREHLELPWPLSVRLHQRVVDVDSRARPTDAATRKSVCFEGVVLWNGSWWKHTNLHQPPCIADAFEHTQAATRRADDDGVDDDGSRT